MVKMGNFRKFWYFRLRNGVIREGESRDGAFKWRFRRFWLDVETASGNWKARWMADEHPYAYLLAGKDDSNIEGFCQMMYYLSKTLTTDQGLVNDVRKSFEKYEKRLGKAAEKEAKQEDEVEEKAALEWEKEVQEYVEKPKRARKKADREVDRKLREMEKNGKRDD